VWSGMGKVGQGERLGVGGDDTWRTPVYTVFSQRGILI